MDQHGNRDLFRSARSRWEGDPHHSALPASQICHGAQRPSFDAQTLQRAQLRQGLGQLHEPVVRDIQVRHDGASVAIPERIRQSLMELGSARLWPMRSAPWESPMVGIGSWFGV